MGLYRSVMGYDPSKYKPVREQEPYYMDAVDRRFAELKAQREQYGRILPDRYVKTPFGKAPVEQYYGRQTRNEDPDFTLNEETPRVTKALQFRTFQGEMVESIQVISSNVVAMSYNPSQNKLTVEFRRYIRGVGSVVGGGPKYLYYNITMEEWRSAKTAGSKGKWVWAVLRRGGKTYMRVR